MDNFFVWKVIQVVQSFKDLEHDRFRLLFLEFFFLLEVFGQFGTLTVFQSQTESGVIKFNDFVKSDNIGMTELLMGFTLPKEVF